LTNSLASLKPGCPLSGVFTRDSLIVIPLISKVSPSATCVTFPTSSISIEKEKDLELNLDFILSHFEEPLFPRTISTKTSEGKQILVNSKEEALARFKQAGYMDCRINAFPSYIEHRGKIIQKSNFIFIDIDQQRFSTEEELDITVKRCLEKIDKRFNHGSAVYPTVLYTGNGYHIYLPIKGEVLEDYSDFSKYGQISQKFLRFAAYHLSDGKSDPNNNPSFKSCLVRIPRTINTKSDSEVIIIQRWNGIRPQYSLINGDFMAYLVDGWIAEQRRLKKLETVSANHHNNSSKPIPWIETLLSILIDDYRKNVVDLILAPYLINTRKLEPNEAYKIIYSWLEKCNNIRRLDFNPHSRIKDGIKTAIKTKYKPMGLEKLKERNNHLYHLIVTG
jgi:hypothetical protein